MNREDFTILRNSNVVYFDNGATSLKPKVVLDSMQDYYENYCANIHRGDYDISLKAENLLENKVDPNVREKDTLEYKKIYSLLNKSFWIARQKASEEKIKYPSALYEKTVREYQNQILIDEYNILLYLIFQRNFYHLTLQ